MEPTCRHLSTLLAAALTASVALGACAQPADLKGSTKLTRHLAAPNWKVGLYTDSSFGTLLSEQSALQSAGASASLQLYLNYGDFKNFEGNPSVGQGIVDVNSLNDNNIQLVLAFEPTNASFCSHSSITSGNSHGCRLSDLTANSPNAVAAANAYANIAKLADALNQPLIVRFASEMNANWDDWDYGYDHAGNSPQDYIAAFEFFHHYVHKNLQQGQVLFAFAPNNHSYDGSSFATDIQNFWPGSAIVDLISLDGYSVANSFQTDFDAQLQELEALGNQPLMLAEFAASTRVAGGRAAWLDAAVADLAANHPRLQYLNWFDSDKSHPYQLQDTDGTGQSLYAEFALDLLGGGSGGAGPTANTPPQGQISGSAASATSAPLPVGQGCSASADCTGGDPTITESCSPDGICLTTLGASCASGGQANDSLCNGGANGEQEICSDSQVCATGCHSDSDCPSATPHCDTTQPTWTCSPAPANPSGSPSSCDLSGQACNPATDVCCDPAAACQASAQGQSQCCLADGNASTAGDGSDCCSGQSAFGADGLCGDAQIAPPSPCIPSGQPSLTSDGTDCCGGTAQYTPSTNLCLAPPACLPDGQASPTADATDCCSGNYDPSSGNCGTPACVADGQLSPTADATDCCSGNYNAVSGNCGP